MSAKRDSRRDLIVNPKYKEQTALVLRQLTYTIKDLSSDPNKETILSSIGVTPPTKCKKCYDRWYIGTFDHTPNPPTYALCKCIIQAVSNREPVDIDKQINHTKEHSSYVNGANKGTEEAAVGTTGSGREGEPKE